MILDQYPFICETALHFAYENDGINRFSSEQAFLEKVSAIVENELTQTERVYLEEWLQTLTVKERETVVMGDYEEVQEIRERCPCHPALRVFDQISDEC